MTKIQTVTAWFSSLAKEICLISYNLFKLMIPIIIVVKIIDELGGIEYIGIALAPMMEFVGLPASMGLVWATTMVTNMYGGMIIFITMAGNESMSVAQVTVLGCMMLFAHSLPIEVRITQKAGVRVLYMLVLRIGGALLLGFLLHKIYSVGNVLTEENVALWQPQISTDTSLSSWAWSQVKAFGQIFMIIAALMLLLRLLKLSGIEKLMIYLLQPLLRLLGLSEKTTSITIIGFTLGLTFGGGLLINEAQSGKISKQEIFGSMTLLALCHSVIEDTVLIMLLGAHISGALYFRVFFSIFVAMIIIRLVRKLSDKTMSRYFA